jgi:hypothetical protein
MRKRTIPAGKVFARWRKDPAYLSAYGNLAGEFAAKRARLLETLATWEDVDDDIPEIADPPSGPVKR